MATVQELMNLRGRTAIVTGGATGIGFQMATGLAEAGANLVICSRKVENCEAAAERLRALGVEVLAAGCDVTRPEQVEALKDQVMARFGRVDVLVNNAGRAWAAEPEDTPVERWQQVLDLNLTAPFICSQVFGRVMIAQRGGRIINIASVAGVIARKSYSSIAYCSSKGGLVNFTRDLAVKWAKHDIRVNCICPGFFVTTLNQPLYERNRDSIVSEIPLGKVGGADDLKGLVVLLASDAANFMTGAIIPVDGGQVAW